MLLMGFSTMAVGLLPTYQRVGQLAPVLLVILRLVQGFAVAGEISGAGSMILEHARFGRRGFYASFTLQGVQAGQIIAAAVFLPLAAYMSDEAFKSWGWRIPFLLSLLVIIAGYIIRRRVDETPAFAEENKLGEAPIVEAIRVSWKDMLRVVCMALMNVIAVVAAIFGAAYAVQPAYGIDFHKDVYLWIPVLGNIVAVFIIPFVGNLSDEIGPRPPIIIGALASGVLSFAYLYAISIHSVPLAIAMSLLMWGVVYQGNNVIFPSFYPELFQTRTRVSAMAISQNVGTHHGATSGSVCIRGPARLDPCATHGRCDGLHYNGYLGGRRHECPRNLSEPHERPRSTGRGSSRETGIRPGAGANSCRRNAGQRRRGLVQSRVQNDTCGESARAFFELSRAEFSRPKSPWQDRMFATASDFGTALQPTHLQYANLVVKRAVWR
jgi:MFS family permease